MQIASLIILAMVLIVSCAPKPDAAVEKKAVDIPAATGEEPVDAVAKDISEVGNVDEGLDTSELDDVDSILEDIENI